jgi:hypothetical protein
LSTIQHSSRKEEAAVCGQHLKRVATVHSQPVALYQFKKLIDTQNIPDPAPIHNQYRDLFNLVDLGDHYWYEVNETHANWIWKSKLLLGILRFAVTLISEIFLNENNDLFSKKLPLLKKLTTATEEIE